MKRTGKAQPLATPGAVPSVPGQSRDPVGSAGAAPPAVASDPLEQTADRPTPVESIAGEEDPGSALEQFSDLMQGAPAQGDPATNTARPQPSLAARRPGSSEVDAESSPSLKKAPDRPA